MFKKFIIILILFFIIPTSSALCDSETILSSNEYYFNATSVSDGDGSIDAPYKNLENNIKVYSVNHLANGEYSINKDLQISDITFIGEDSSKTIINCNGAVLNNTKSLNLYNLTLCDFTIINKGSLNCQNTIFSHGYGLNVDKYGNSFGGAIYTPYNDSKIFTVNIDNCIFENNYAEYGGAIYMDGGVLNIVNSKFINNTAYNYGGSIACEYNTRISINKTQFINSKSINDAGGSIYLKLVNFTSNRMEIINSTSTFGAITALNSNITLIRLNAINNTATYDGGAFYQLYGRLTIQNSNIINNTAKNGGGLFLDNLSYTLVVSNTFENNTAAEYGGAIYSLLNPKISPMNTFKNNTPEVYETSSLNTSKIGEGNYTIFINNNTQFSQIPDYYNLNDYNYVSSIKSQQYGGNCWAFASIAALESCILKATGIELDLSEENMKNLIELYSDYGWSMDTNEGGYNNMGIGYLTSWMGPVLEINDTYDDYSTLSPLLNSILHIQNVKFLKRDNYTDNDEIKKAILQYGGVATGICYYEEYLKGNNYYYYSTFGYSNHAVTIVGWNDTYSKNNFYGNPEIDGAWIVKNSWGESWGDNGYFYVSYCDRKLAQIGLSESSYTFILNDGMKYDKNYQYDVIGKTNYFSNNENEIWYFNTFKSTNDEVLAAVSTHFEKISSWNLSVYVNDILKLTQEGICDEGYYTIKLNDYIPLKKDDTFKIVFKISGEGSFRVPISEKSYSNKFLSTNNISFFSYDGVVWHDLYTSISPSVASIKAFTLTSKIKNNITVNVSNNQLNPVEITATVCDEYSRIVKSGNITFILENQEYGVEINDGIAKIYHNFTHGGLNNVVALFSNDIYDLSNKTVIFDVNITNSHIISQDIEIYFTNQTKYSIQLLDSQNNPLANKKVLFIINDTIFENTTDDMGYASLLLNLKVGEYNIAVAFSGDEKYVKSNNISKITILSTITLPNHTIYSQNSKYHINIHNNTDKVMLVINSDEYILKLNPNGVVDFNINLKPGSYVFKIINIVNNESKTAVIKVVSRISENKEVSIYFRSKYSYKIHVFDDYGNNAKKGEIVKFTISGKTYTKEVDKNGYCYLPISLSVGKYTIKISYSGFEVSNTIVIKATLKAKDMTIKKGKTLKFKVKLVNTNGKILKNKKITFKIKNKKYTAKTNKKGIATIQIKKLKLGKYTITSIYNKIKIKNKITVKK